MTDKKSKGKNLLAFVVSHPSPSHPNDEDLSFHPRKHKSLPGDPGVGDPVSAKDGAPQFGVGIESARQDAGHE